VSVAPRCSAPPDEHRNQARVSLAGSLRRSPKRRTSSLRQATCDLVGRIAMESTPASPYAGPRRLYWTRFGRGEEAESTQGALLGPLFGQIHEGVLRSSPRGCMKSGSQVVIRYSSTHEKTLPNRSLRRRMELHQASLASSQRIWTPQDPRSS
jgi:hypothetical protein